MSAENVTLVRKIHETWNSGRSPSEFFHEEIEYVNPPYAVEPGVRTGSRSFAAVREVYGEFTIETERFIDAGDDVVVIGVARGRSSSGIDLEWRQGYVWTVRDGLAVRFRWFNDPLEALAAAGLPSDAAG